MRNLVGGPGTVSGLCLRIGQCVFASASIATMLSAFGFSGFTAYCYLIASMGLQMLWSFALACLDVYALRIKRDLLSHVLLCLFVVGDWVNGTLTLAAACSSAGVIVLYEKDFAFCRRRPEIPCSTFEVSVILAFFTWFLTAVSSLVMFWLLSSV